MPQAGFRLNGPSDVQRFELCLGDLEPLARVSTKAHAFKTWMELFFGLHMRSRGLFGTVNQKKVRTLRSGLRGYLESGPEFFRARSVLFNRLCSARCLGKNWRVYLRFFRLAESSSPSIPVSK